MNMLLFVQMDCRVRIPFFISLFQHLPQPVSFHYSKIIRELFRSICLK